MAAGPRRLRAGGRGLAAKAATNAKKKKEVATPCKSICPNAAKNYDAVMEYPISDEHLAFIKLYNDEAAEVISAYRDHAPIMVAPVK